MCDASPGVASSPLVHLKPATRPPALPTVRVKRRPSRVYGRVCGWRITGEDQTARRCRARPRRCRHPAAGGLRHRQQLDERVVRQRWQFHGGNVDHQVPVRFGEPDAGRFDRTGQRDQPVVEDVREQVQRRQHQQRRRRLRCRCDAVRVRAPSTGPVRTSRCRPPTSPRRTRAARPARRSTCRWPPVRSRSATTCPTSSKLNLSAATLAKIFSGKIAKWNDPAIAKDNPGVTLPDTRNPDVPPFRWLGHQLQLQQLPVQRRQVGLDLRREQAVAGHGRPGRQR